MLNGPHEIILTCHICQCIAVLLVIAVDQASVDCVDPLQAMSCEILDVLSTASAEQPADHSAHHGYDVESTMAAVTTQNLSHSHELLAVLLSDRPTEKMFFGVGFKDDFVKPSFFRNSLFSLIHLMIIYSYFPSLHIYSFCHFLPKPGGIRVVHSLCSFSKRVARAVFLTAEMESPDFAFGGIKRRRRGEEA